MVVAEPPKQTKDDRLFPELPAKTTAISVLELPRQTKDDMCSLSSHTTRWWVLSSLGASQNKGEAVQGLDGGWLDGWMKRMAKERRRL